jgi:serine/threonine protein phosphatase PrpC
VDRDAPVLGRPSTAAAETAVLRDRGGAGDAAVRADGGDSDWCALRAASVAGVRHRLAGQPGQDSFAWACLPGGLVVAIADGLGGVPGSDHTAGRAAAAGVEAVVEAMTAPGTSAGPTELQLAAGLEAANAAAAERGATTLVLGLMGPAGQLSLARVGDSSAFHVGAEGRWWQEVFAPPKDDDLITVTAALPAEKLEPEFAALTVTTEDVLVLATDGVADPWRDGPATVAPVLAATLAGRPGPLELAQLAGFSRQGCHDDRTILVIWRRG